jgi:hypothetical protein
MEILYYIEQFLHVLGSVVVFEVYKNTYHLKYHRGRVLVSQPVWVVCAFCRRIKLVALKIFRKRDEASYTKFVTENIAGFNYYNRYVAVL